MMSSVGGRASCSVRSVGAVRKVAGESEATAGASSLADEEGPAGEVPAAAAAAMAVSVVGGAAAGVDMYVGARVEGEGRNVGAGLEAEGGVGLMGAAKGSGRAAGAKRLVSGARRVAPTPPGRSTPRANTKGYMSLKFSGT